MKVSEIMTTNFEMVEATSPLTEAAEKMASLNVGLLPVKEGTKLIGLITDRDIVVRALAAKRDPSETQVKDIITSQLVCCIDSDSIESAVQLMEEKQVRRLIVCNEKKEPIGVVSLGDVAAKAQQDELAGEALESISEPAVPTR